MTTPDREESAVPDDDIYYPSDDAGMMWLLAEDVRASIKQTLDPESAERLLVKLERIFESHGIYKPGDWPG